MKKGVCLEMSPAADGSKYARKPRKARVPLLWGAELTSTNAQFLSLWESPLSHTHYTK